MTIHPNTNRELMVLHQQGGWAARLSLGLPLASGVLLVVQTWSLATVLHRAIVERASLPNLMAPIAMILGLIAVRTGLGMLGEMLAVASSEAIKLNLRQRLFGAMLGKLPIWTGARSSGALSVLTLEQVEAFDGFFVRYMPAMIQAATLPIAFAVVIFPVDWVAALIFIFTAPLIPIFMMLAGWGAEAASRAQARALGLLTGRFADRLRGVVTLKLFGRDVEETAAMFEAGEELRRRSMKVMRIAFLSSAVLEFYAALGVAGVALYCGLSLLGLVHLRASPLSLEAALFCLLMAPEVYQPLRLLAANYHDRAAAKAALIEIKEMMGGLPGSVRTETSAALAVPPTPSGPLSVSLRHVAVATPTGEPVLVDVDLDFARGDHIAILGPSGSGKSTFLETLARLRAFRGDIALDGRPLAKIEDAELRRRIAMVGQRPYLFAGTIADNIRLGRPEACDTAVESAARGALVIDFAKTLPRGLNTLVGENGLGLSGGEIQRVALARLYLRDPGLILLDEPMAHLDPATELRVLDNLLSFARNRTLVVATHSPSTAARMRRTYRIAGGRLLASPSPRLSDAELTRGAA
jgi:ATP-binding cassette subfamily C protein CydD